jgi:3-dehydroquinate synthase
MRVLEQNFAVAYAYPVVFTRDAFGPDNPALGRVLPQGSASPHRMLAVVDDNVLQAAPDLPTRLAAWAGAADPRVTLVSPPVAVAGGEVCKQGPAEVERVRAWIEKHQLCRQSFVLAIGGGAVLDAVGYAAATAHRGVRLIRMPTTVLAQNDAGVGVKNGINAFGKKNYLGTFAPPFAVVNDFAFLDTLPAREARAGLAEAVKVAVIRDRAFFDFLYRERRRLGRLERAPLEESVVRCAELHLEHIRTGGDPFEFGSARPLDFGHWSAHRLEELTSGELRHGEAVAIGIALDCLIAQDLGLLSQFEAERILATLEAMGLALHHWALRWLDPPAALEGFRQHLGGRLHITLPNGIGARVEIGELDANVARRACEGLARRLGPQAGAGAAPRPARVAAEE